MKLSNLGQPRVDDIVQFRLASEKYCMAASGQLRKVLSDFGSPSGNSKFFGTTMIVMALVSYLEFIQISSQSYPVDLVPSGT